jgi:hypothetical protein
MHTAIATSTAGINTPGKTKITSKIAESLNKYRLSADLDAHYEHQVRLTHNHSHHLRSNNEEDEASDDSEESEMELSFANLKMTPGGGSKGVVAAKSGGSGVKTKVTTRNGVVGVMPASAASFSAGKGPSNEIWLEYGCI